MIAVLGPADAAEAVAAAVRGELVVGAGDDAALADAASDAARSAAELPLPVRACVVVTDRRPDRACAAVRSAGGALSGATVYVLGKHVERAPARWTRLVEDAGAVPAPDLDMLAAMLATPAHPDKRGSRRQGAPDPNAWREWLRAAPTRRRLPWRRVTSADLPSQRRFSEAHLDTLIRRSLAPDARSVAVISPKGGVGKTMLSFLLGSVLAEVRAERVVAVDANPDFGTLADLVGSRVSATISDLFREASRIEAAEELSRYVTTTETGLRILAATQDPLEMGLLGSAAYRIVDHVVRRFNEMVIYDCGTGFADAATQLTLRTADHVVLVAAPQLVTAKIVLAAVEHLEESDFDLKRATLVLNKTGRGDRVDADRLHAALGGRIGGVVEVPFDARLQREVDLGYFRFSQLTQTTRLALKRLAMEVVVRLPGGNRSDIMLDEPS